MPAQQGVSHILNLLAKDKAIFDRAKGSTNPYAPTRLPHGEYYAQLKDCTIGLGGAEPKAAQFGYVFIVMCDKDGLTEGVQGQQLRVSHTLQASEKQTKEQKYEKWLWDLQAMDVETSGIDFPKEVPAIHEFLLAEPRYVKLRVSGKPGERAFTNIDCLIARETVEALVDLNNVEGSDFVQEMEPEYEEASDEEAVAEGEEEEASDEEAVAEGEEEAVEGEEEAVEEGVEGEEGTEEVVEGEEGEGEVEEEEPEPEPEVAPVRRPAPKPVARPGVVKAPVKAPPKSIPMRPAAVKPGVAVKKAAPAVAPLRQPVKKAPPPPPKRK